MFYSVLRYAKTFPPLLGPDCRFGASFDITLFNGLECSYLLDTREASREASREDIRSGSIVETEVINLEASYMVLLPRQGDNCVHRTCCMTMRSLRFPLVDGNDLLFVPQGFN